MTWELLKRDPAWRWTLFLTPAFGAICALWHFFARERDSLHSILLLFELFSGIMLVSGPTAFAQSADTGFQATLPVTVRQVFLSRILAMIALMGLPLAAGAAVLIAFADPVKYTLSLEIWAPLTCVPLGIQCALIRRVYLRSRRILIFLPLWVFVAAAAGIGRRLEGNSISGVLVWTVCGAIMAAILLRTWHVVPLSFQDAPRKAAPAKVARAALSRRIFGAPSWMPLFRMLLEISGWSGLILFAVISLSGTANLFIYLWPGLVWGRVKRRTWLLALPLPRTILLAAAALPILLALCAGYELNIRRPWIPGADARRVSIRRNTAHCVMPNVVPSREYWIPVRSGKAPPIESPWGETLQPFTDHALGFDIYNPYSVDCDSSARFLKWQFNRATKAIYGRGMRLDRKVAMDGGVKQTAIFSLRTQLVSIAGLTAISLLSLLIAMIFDWYRFRRLPKLMGTALFGGLVSALFLWAKHGDLDLTLWVLWTLPANPKIAGAVAVVTLALLCAAINGVFREVEFADKRGSTRA